MTLERAFPQEGTHSLLFPRMEGAIQALAFLDQVVEETGGLVVETVEWEAPCRMETLGLALVEQAARPQWVVGVEVIPERAFLEQGEVATSTLAPDFPVLEVGVEEGPIQARDCLEQEGVAVTLTPEPDFLGLEEEVEVEEELTLELGCPGPVVKMAPTPMRSRGLVTDHCPQCQEAALVKPSPTRQGVAIPAPGP